MAKASQGAGTQGLLLLVDGSSYLYRAFHALPALANAQGEPTGAIYGVVNMLRRLLADYPAGHVAVVFDARGPTFRNEIFPEYKAHRPPMAEELVAQVPPLFEIVRALGLPLVQVSGVEADDVIATLVEVARRAGLGAVISSGDKDLAQLVGPGVVLVNTMSETVLDEAGVAEKFGIPPHLMVDYLALMGDTVDNVPGIKGVGPKTAAKWLLEYGSLDGLVARAGEVKGKVGEALRAGLPQLPLARELVTVRRDVPLPCELAELVPQPPDTAALGELYRRYGLLSWLRELEGPRGGGAGGARAGGRGAGAYSAAPGANPTAASPSSYPPRSAPRYDLILTEAAWAVWLARLEAAPCFAFDTETTSLVYLDARIVGVSFAVAEGEAAYVPLAHRYLGCPQQLDRERILADLRPLLEDAGRPKIAQHGKYDLHVLANHGIAFRGLAHDTLLESYCLDAGTGRHDLDALALRHLGWTTIHYEDVAGKGAKQIPFAEVPLEQAGPYAAEDAEVCLAVHGRLWPRLIADPGRRAVYETLEIPLVPVLARMERAGVRIDGALLQAHGLELGQALAALEEQAWRLAGEGFNLGSPKQIQHILYDKLKLPIKGKTPKGEPSTDAQILQELAEEYELPALLLEHRQLAKLKSTYTDKLPELVRADTGRVHTSYHQTGAETGRLSSSDPNLQNIPIRTPEGRRIRQAFIAAPGFRLVAADYSQIELRIMAHLSQDAGLLAAFAGGEDIHRATAAEVFGLPLAAVTGEQRRAAKAINFGLLYGMSAFGLAKALKVDRHAAQEYMTLYFARYPGVRRCMVEIRREAAERGYVETLFHRRLHIPDLKARNSQRRQLAERAAINAPMQGTAADIIKLAMIAVDGWLSARGEWARMIMQVHDELVLEVREGRVAEVVAALPGLMCTVARLDVPLVVDVGVGANWDEAH
jgi:DNA polymerase-1